jgi:ATP phosphoribosyltransferase regulatory subunit
MKNERWLLPEGIEEVLPEGAWRLELLRRRLLDLFSAWGYELVLPPFIEYLESLLVGTGNDLDLQTFKLTDQLSGRLMGVRADMTPQVARIDAHRLKRETPTRLCYMGTVLRTRPEGHGGSRSPLQVGAELYGHAGIDSDVEVLRLMLAMLRAAGLDQLYLDLGHVGIFRGLTRQAGLDSAQEAQLFDALQRKSRPDISVLLASLTLTDDVRRMLLQLADLNGGEDALAEARKALAPASAEVLAALDNLEAIAGAVSRALPGTPLHFDLAELRGYHYHTGVVFAAYAPGSGQAVAQGGRYDDIGRVFGRARPATGFSADLKALLTLSTATLPGVRGIFAPCADDPALARQVEDLRADGERVVCALPGQQGDAAAMGCDRQLALRDGRWQVVTLG